MTSRKHSKQAPPVGGKACPTDEEGKDLCNFHYEAVNARETNGDWLAQLCYQCTKLTFIDKRKLVHGQGS